MRTKEQILSLQIVTTEEKNDKGTVTTSRFFSDREKILEVLIDIRDQLIEANKIDGNKIYLHQTPVTKTTIVNYEVDIKRIFEDGTTAHLESIEFESTGKLMTRSEILTVALSKIQ